MPPRMWLFEPRCKAFTINVMNAAINVKHLLLIWDQFCAKARLVHPHLHKR
jgi:hypothetical protein